MTPGRPTMQDIAKLAGVSVATVSMCFRNNPQISVATRTRVLEIADKLNYRPNPYISALLRSRRYGKNQPNRPVIAMVCLDSAPDRWKKSPSATLRQMHAGASQQAESHGYQCQDFWIHQDGMSNERFSEMLHARGIQGVLFGPLPDQAPPPVLQWPHFTAVYLGAPSRGLLLPTVCNDHYFSSFRAVEECQRLGYERPGLVLRRSHHDRFLGRWEAGFLAAQDAPGRSPIRPLLVESWDDFAGFRSWFEKEKPDVVVSLRAEHVEQWLGRLGLHAPQDLGLVTLSCQEPGDRLSGIFQNGQLTGASAMDLLIARMERHDRGLPTQTITLMVEGLWNPGRTLRSAPAPADALSA